MSGHGLIPSKPELLSKNNTNGFDAAFGRSSSGGEEEQYFRPLALNNRVTFSFAPDGTSIFSHESSLYQSFGNLLDAAELENTIINAFKTWATEGNLDAGLVDDSGDAFGVAGRTYDDDRFGDIRIGAFPMASDVYAIALGQGDFASGTWAGDILFNSQAKFKDAGHFAAVTLHEIGHSLGLNHSEDTASVMHPSATDARLSASDVASFQQLYGIRQLDPHDTFQGNNDTTETATQLKFDDDYGIKGLYPSIVFGDVSNAQDIDFFELKIPDLYQGSFSVELVSRGISLLAADVAILTEGGDVIASTFSTSNRGEDLKLSLPTGHLGEKLFVRVKGASIDQAGSYSLITTLDDRLIADNALIQQVARDPQFTFLEQDDVVDYLVDPVSYLFHDDGHTDDDHINATVLETENGYGFLSRFRYNASLLDEIDVDVYSIESLPFDPATNYVLNVTVHSVDVGGMIPEAAIFDGDGRRVPSTIVVNGLGEFAIQADQIQPETDYFVHVGANDLLAFQSGNYELTISYSEVAVNFQELASGTFRSLGLGSEPGGQYHSLHIAESQMFQFALEADVRSGRKDVLIWATVYDENGSIVHQSATRDGERHTGQSVYFSPGSYTVEIELMSSLGRPIRARKGINYRLLGINVGDGQGPDFNDPTGSPFNKNGQGQYEYPDDVLSSATFVLVDGVSSNQPDPPADNPPENLFDWYWGL